VEKANQAKEVATKADETKQKVQVESIKRHTQEIGAKAHYTTEIASKANERNSKSAMLSPHEGSRDTKMVCDIMKQRMKASTQLITDARSQLKLTIRIRRKKAVREQAVKREAEHAKAVMAQYVMQMQNPQLAMQAGGPEEANSKELQTKMLAKLRMVQELAKTAQDSDYTLKKAKGKLRQEWEKSKEAIYKHHENCIRRSVSHTTGNAAAAAADDGDSDGDSNEDGVEEPTKTTTTTSITTTTTAPRVLLPTGADDGSGGGGTVYAGPVGGSVIGMIKDNRNQASLPSPSLYTRTMQAPKNNHVGHSSHVDNFWKAAKVISRDSGLHVDTGSNGQESLVTTKNQRATSKSHLQDRSFKRGPPSHVTAFWKMAYAIPQGTVA